MEGLVGTEFFAVIEPYIKLEEYLREGGGSEDPRIRIEFYPMPADVMRKALEFTMPCVACRAPLHPIRERGQGSGNLYYAPSCPLHVNIRCSRTRAPRDEYKRVAAAVRARRPPAGPQGNLFP